MATPASTCRTWEFGVYEVDTRRGELRRKGGRVRLREQSFLVLACLVEHAGDTVTRDELRQLLWPSDVFVDFEHSLSMAVLKLRDALGDSAEKPRYIETVPRRGYRFIAPVSLKEELGPDIPPPEALTEPPPGEQLTRSSRKWRALVVAAACLTCLAGIVLMVYSRHLREPLQSASASFPEASKIESIAVLPLEDLSVDHGQAYFAYGLTDTLITYLGQIVPLRVISRASTMRYMGDRTPLPQIAPELDVDAAVEGTVQRAGEKILISVQLLDARADRHLWAKTYEYSGQDMLGFEKQVALSIAHEISSRAQPAQETRRIGARKVNPEAYDDYLHGRYLLEQRTAEGETGARTYFDEATRLDPGFAPAWAGLADTYSASWSITRNYPLAEKYGRRAVALDPDLAEGHASVGLAETYQHRFTEAGKELERALALNPNYAMAQHWYSLYLVYIGRMEEALAANDRARQLDPYSFPINYLRGVILMCLQESDRAIAQFQFAASINPDSPAPHMDLQRLYWTEGRVREALAEERLFMTLSHKPQGIYALDQIAAAYKKEGLTAARLKDTELKQRHTIYSAQEIAWSYAILRDRANTLKWLGRAFDDDPTDFPLNLSIPSLGWLRSDVKFQELLRRAGVPPAGESK